MRKGLFLLVPCILLVGFLYGVLELQVFSPIAKPCSVGTCPLAIHKSNSGQTFVYPVGTRFEVILDENKDPRSNLQCAPREVISSRGNTISGELYTASFETLAPGTCILSSYDFSAVIIVQ